MNPAVGTENERVETTAIEDIGRSGEDLGVVLCQKIEREIAREDTGGGMSRTMSGPNTDGETVAMMSAITRDDIGHTLDREAGLLEMNESVIPEVVGGAMGDRRIILGLLSALRGNTKRTVIDEMDIAAPVSTGLLTCPANIRENYPHLRQQTETKIQITTRIHWRT